MDEYISRENVLKAFNLIAKNPNKDYQRGMQDTIDCLVPEVIADIPSADVQPVIHAHWKRGEEKGFRTYNPLWYCSNCGGQIRYDTRMRQYQKTKRPVWEVNAFCRKCGARMDGGEKDENDT